MRQGQQPARHHPPHRAPQPDRAEFLLRARQVGEANGRAQQDHRGGDGVPGQRMAYGGDIPHRWWELLRSRHLNNLIEQGIIVCGSPETVLNQLRRIRVELGAGVVSLAFSRGDPSATHETIQFFGREVLPAMHEL